MTMPVLPALQTNKGAAGPLTDLLDAMAPEDVADLAQVATEWGDAGEPPLVGDIEGQSVETDMDTPAEEPLPGDDPVHDESNETPAQEADETPEEQEQEEQAGAENIEGLLAQVQSVAETAETYEKQFDDLAEQAKAAEDQGADPDAIADLKDEAAECVEEIADMLAEAEKAAKDEDAEGVARQGLGIQKHLELLDGLLQQASIHARGHQPAPAEPGSLQGQQPALAAWAANYKG